MIRHIKCGRKGCITICFFFFLFLIQLHTLTYRFIGICHEGKKEMYRTFGHGENDESSHL